MCRGVFSVALSSRVRRDGENRRFPALLARFFGKQASATLPFFFFLPELRSAKRINHVPFEAFLAGFSRKPRGVINGRWIIQPRRKARAPTSLCRIAIRSRAANRSPLEISFLPGSAGKEASRHCDFFRSCARVSRVHVSAKILISIHVSLVYNSVYTSEHMIHIVWYLQFALR